MARVPVYEEHILPLDRRMDIAVSRTLSSQQRPLRASKMRKLRAGKNRVGQTQLLGLYEFPGGATRRGEIRKQNKTCAASSVQFECRELVNFFCSMPISVQLCNFRFHLLDRDSNAVEYSPSQSRHADRCGPNSWESIAAAPSKEEFCEKYKRRQSYFPSG